MVNFVIDGKFKKQIDLGSITRIITKAFSVLGVEPIPDLSIIITNNTKLQSLNKNYRGIDETTDVLSFSNEYVDLDSGVKYLGDIFISYPRAKEQAEAGDHRVDQEVELLIVHGLLHLLGYDHSEKKSKAVMWDLQKQILVDSGTIIDKGGSA